MYAGFAVNDLAPPDLPNGLHLHFQNAPRLPRVDELPEIDDAQNPPELPPADVRPVELEPPVLVPPQTYGLRLKDRPAAAANARRALAVKREIKRHAESSDLIFV